MSVVLPSYHTYSIIFINNWYKNRIARFKF